MPTIRQRKAAKAFVEALESGETVYAGELLESVGYAKSVAEGKPGEILEQKGVQEALQEYGFTEENAKRVVSEILLDGRRKAADRLNAADKIFKVVGSYAPEKHITMRVVPIYGGKSIENVQRHDSDTEDI